MSRVLDLISVAHGQCRLSVVSGTQLKLSPFNGRNLAIDGQLQRIPSAGVTIANTGLAASTLYYVYAYMNAGVMALELSATGHSQHTDGVEIKTGNSSRTLVGMIYTNESTPGQFVDSLTSPTCLNWFNRRDIPGASPTVTGTTASTGSFAEITTSARIPFLAWANEAVEIVVIGAVSNNTGGNITNTTAPGLDGASYGAQTQATTYAASVSFPAMARAISTVSEGFHTASAFGKVGSGTGSWSFGTQTKTRG